MTKTLGTIEWADKPNFNIFKGCKNGCKYCYALGCAQKYKRDHSTYADWMGNMILNREMFEKKFHAPKQPMRKMLFTSHDIVKDHLQECTLFLNKIAEIPEYSLLITTKPDWECIRYLCNNLASFKAKIQFRFTIGTTDDSVLKFWEPNAPNYNNRRDSVQYAFEQGFKTSLSLEPFLDAYPEKVIADLSPWISESVWLGIMNEILMPMEYKGLYQNVKSLYTRESLTQIIAKCEKATPAPIRFHCKDAIRNLLAKPMKPRKINYELLDQFIHEQEEAENSRIEIGYDSHSLEDE